MSLAAAERSVIVLGLHSVEGDDSVSFALSGALRRASANVQHWDVRDQAVTLNQMSLAHGCEDVDAHCLADIATALGVDLIIYGTVRRSSARRNYDYVARLNLFDASTGAIERDTTLNFDQSVQDAAALKPVAKKLVMQLSPSGSSTGLTIKTNVPGAELYLDGDLIGQLSHDAYTVDDLSPGEYQLEVTALGYTTFSRMVAVKAGKAVTVTAELEPSGEDEGDDDELAEDDSYSSAYPTVGDGVPAWLMGVTFGVGVAGLAGMVVSWFMIDGVAKDDAYATYSGAVFDSNPGNPVMYNDVCVAADDGVMPSSTTAQNVSEIKDLCSRAGTFELLQWVFLGVGAAGVLTGVTLLVIDGTTEDSQGVGASDGPSLALQPLVSTERAGLTATLRF